MVEKLISRKEASARLSISTRTFARRKAKLMALGLQAVQIGQYPKFRESSLDKLIQRLAENGGQV
jgi:hypothetical protein